MDYIFFNNKKPSKKRILKYEKEGANFIEYNKEDFKKIHIIEKNFLRDKGFIRHDSKKLAKAIIDLLRN